MVADLCHFVFSQGRRQKEKKNEAKPGEKTKQRHNEKAKCDKNRPMKM